MPVFILRHNTDTISVANPLRAELTRILAAIWEKNGKVKEAATVLQEVQVETLGKFDNKQKTKFILEQVSGNSSYYGVWVSMYV